MVTAVDAEDVRLAVYESFAATGRAPDLETLAAGSSPAGVQDALRRLADARHVVLDAAGQIAMAHPFSAVPLGFAVMGPRTLWWGGCAWDSFALPHLVPDAPEVLVATTCPACRQPLAWRVGREEPPAGEQVAHFLVPAREMWRDVLHTCGNQRLFCRRDCVDSWLALTGHARGHVMDLATLWSLARHWYDGRLSRGYTRRDPVSAGEYFRSVGLTGPFWEP
jgi:hypothetical protein